MGLSVYGHFSNSDGCHRHRLLYPFRHCDADLGDWDFELCLGDPRRPFNVYATHGLTNYANFKYLTKWKMESGGIWAWSLDDDFLTVDDSNPCKPTDDELLNWHLSRDLADAILCSTPALAASVAHPDKTLVARNLIDVASYGVPDPAPDRDTVRVLWAGSRTHDRDLALLVDPLDAVLSRWRGKVDVVFMGSAPGKLLQKWLGDGVHFEKGVGFEQYAKVLRQVRPDIVLAPLADTVFNRSKSNIRVLEGWSLAAAVVASPVGEYGVVRDGVDGLSATTPAEWYDRIDRLIADADYRRSLARTGRDRVAAEWDWANPRCRTEWVAAFREIERRVWVKSG
jgi:glycosyltransferase involved in cell wall biosynthesis